jgi:hypothetical protein
VLHRLLPAAALSAAAVKGAVHVAVGGASVPRAMANAQTACFVFAQYVLCIKQVKSGYS